MALTSADTAARNASRRINWDAVRTQAVIPGNWFGRKKVKAVQVTVCIGEDSHEFYLIQEGRLVEGRPEIFCSPLCTGMLPTETRMALTAVLESLPATA